MAVLKNRPSSPHLYFPILAAVVVSVVCLLLLPSSLAVSVAAASESTTIYDYLHQNGLPIGIFPEGITNFSVDPTTGRFLINLTQPCNVKLQNQLHYDFNISGVLSLGRIEEISGMSQQELFLWFPVKGIRVDDPASGLIHFDVGVVDTQFTLSTFEIPVPCTDGDYSSPSSLSYGFQKLDEQERIGAGQEKPGVLMMADA